MKKIILATGNPGKISELSTLLAPIACIPQATLEIEDVAETGLSFVENAIIKARHASRLAEKPALADDSGLVVEALNGEPGIYSARFAKESGSDKDNITLLLNKLCDVPDGKRQAYFYCAIVMVKHALDPTPLIACGRVDGKISMVATGEHGFGYDPVFYLENYRCTMAQLPAKIKNKISHRAQALQFLQQQLATLYD